MKAMLLLAVLLAPALLAAPARAADPALVTGVEKYLRDDEKALLAALLVRPELSAEFDAEAPLALKNPKNLGPFLGVWRGKLEAFAEADAKRGDPNLDGRYSSYAQLMTPEQRAFMVRRLPTMKEDDRNSLIDYLKKVNDALAKYGELTWYTKKVVSGIMDHYRADLSGYVATPMAQTAKRDAAASLLAFAAIKKADEDARLAAAKPVKPAKPAPVEVADARAAKPARKPAPAKKPAPATRPAAPVETGGGAAETKPSGGALQQAQDVVDNGANGGAVMDGGAPAQRPSGGGAVIVPPSNGGPRPSELTPSKPGSEAGLTAALPEVPSPAGTNDMDALLKMQTKPAKTPWINHVPAIAGGLLGGLLGAVLGFLVGGPIGAIVGAAAGAAAGAAGGHLLAKKLFQ